MKIFKPINDSTGKNGKFVGFYMEPDMGVDITLTAISERISKSSLIRSIVSKHLVKKEDLLFLVANQAYLTWQSMGKSWRIPLVEFRKNIKSDLASKGVPIKVVAQIVEKFDALLK